MSKEEYKEQLKDIARARQLLQGETQNAPVISSSSMHKRKHEAGEKEVTSARKKRGRPPKNKGVKSDSQDPKVALPNITNLNPTTEELDCVRAYIKDLPQFDELTNKFVAESAIRSIGIYSIPSRPDLAVSAYQHIRLCILDYILRGALTDYSALSCSDVFFGIRKEYSICKDEIDDPMPEKTQYVCGVIEEQLKIYDLVLLVCQMFGEIPENSNAKDFYYDRVMDLTGSWPECQVIFQILSVASNDPDAMPQVFVKHFAHQLNDHVEYYINHISDKALGPKALLDFSTREQSIYDMGAEEPEVEKEAEKIVDAAVSDKLPTILGESFFSPEALTDEQAIEIEEQNLHKMAEIDRLADESKASQNETTKQIPLATDNTITIGTSAILNRNAEKLLEPVVFKQPDAKPARPYLYEPKQKEVPAVTQTVEPDISTSLSPMLQGYEDAVRKSIAVIKEQQDRIAQLDSKVKNLEGQMKVQKDTILLLEKKLSDREGLRKSLPDININRASVISQNRAVMESDMVMIESKLPPSQPAFKRSSALLSADVYAQAKKITKKFSSFVGANKDYLERLKTLLAGSDLIDFLNRKDMARKLSDPSTVNHLSSRIDRAFQQASGGQAQPATRTQAAQAENSSLSQLGDLIKDITG